VGVDAWLPSVRRRFIKASIGWIRYKPLLTFITQPDNYDSTISEMMRKLDLAVPKLCSYFRTREFERIPVELERYHRNVRRHHRTFALTREAWLKITSSLLPIASSN
jgi:hypothetical protein